MSNPNPLRIPSPCTFSSFNYLIVPKNRIPDLAESSDEDAKRFIATVRFADYYQVADTVTSIYHITPTTLINVCTNLSSAKSPILPSLWMRDYRGLFFAIQYDENHPLLRSI